MLPAVWWAQIVVTTHLGPESDSVDCRILLRSSRIEEMLHNLVCTMEDDGDHELSWSTTCFLKTPNLKHWRSALQSKHLQPPR